MQSELLERRYDCPLRPHLSDALSQMRLKSPSVECWEWLGEIEWCRPFLLRERQYAVFPDTHRRLSGLIRLNESERVDDLGAALAIASDPFGMIEAEDQAIEYCRRMTFWGATWNGRTTWYFADKHEDNLLLCDAHNRLFDNVATATSQMHIDFFAKAGSMSSSLPPAIRHTLALGHCWREGSRLGLEIPPCGDVWGLRYNDVECPFDPLIQLWLTGYRIEPILTDDEPLFRLYVRPVLVNRDFCAEQLGKKKGKQ